MAGITKMIAINNTKTFEEETITDELFYKRCSHPTIVFRNYRDNCEKRCCSGSHKQCKTLLKDHVVRFKIISLHIYKNFEN